MNIDLEMQAITEKEIRLMKKARTICKTANKTYEFECPNCGEKARAGKASINNHIHLRCDKCNISIMQ